MILGLGIDNVTISSVDRFLQNPDYAKDIFTENEIALAQEAGDATDFFAGRFAAKQAIKKALEPLVGRDVYNYLLVETLKREDGSPVVTLFGDLKKAVEKAGVDEVRVTTSTEGDLATAFAIAQNK